MPREKLVLITGPIEDRKDQVQASRVRGHFTLHLRRQAGTRSGIWWAGWDGVGMRVFSGSSRREGSFLLESVHHVRWHSVRGDSELMGHSVML